MSWFRYVIFSNPSTLYTLGLPPRNGGITEDCIRNWALHLNIWNLTLYICRSITHTEALPMPQHNHTGALTIPEHNHNWALPTPEHYYPCQSITHTEALPMPEHPNVEAYQCWSIPMSELTNVGASQCRSIPISEHTKDQCCLQPLVVFINFGTEQTTPSQKLLYIHILLYKPSGCYFNRQIALVLDLIMNFYVKLWIEFPIVSLFLYVILVILLLCAYEDC